MEKDKKYLKEKAVSQMTGIAVQTLRNHRHLRTGINYVKLNRSVRYDLNDVIGYMESRKITL